MTDFDGDKNLLKFFMPITIRYRSFLLQVELNIARGDCLWQRGVEVEDPILMIILAIVHTLRKSQSDSHSVERRWWNVGCQRNTIFRF